MLEYSKSFYMKFEIKYAIMCLALMMMVYISCKKELSCENCIENNKPPIAVAGPDQVITLPTDSVLLNGSASSDPDGKISGYLWTRLSGPASFAILRPTDSATKITTLVAGTYQFELKVTDNAGLSANDTVQVIVDSIVTPNHPPIANAGSNQIISLPTNTAYLDGSGSTDPDNNITGYLWNRISGPTLSNIANSNSVQTQATNLVEGIYQFELKVTDARGLFSKDTVRVTVSTLTTQPPVGNAEPDIILTLPLDSVIIPGTFDAWWSPELYNWTQISGPSVVNTNVNPSAQLFARQLIPGTYSFQIKNNTIVDTINVLVINDQQDPNTITFKNLKWVLADEYGIGFTDLSLRLSPQPCLFIMPGYQLRPLEVYLQLDPASQWLKVPSVQSGASFGYDSSSNGIWIMRLPVDNVWAGKKSSIKVKLL